MKINENEFLIKRKRIFKAMNALLNMNYLVHWFYICFGI